MQKDQDTIQKADADALKSLSRPESGSKKEIFIHESDNDTKEVKSAEQSDKKESAAEDNNKKETPQAE